MLEPNPDESESAVRRAVEVIAANPAYGAVVDLGHLDEHIRVHRAAATSPCSAVGLALFEHFAIHYDARMG